MSHLSIGLAGRSGSGKSTIAKYLSENYNYKICYPGGKVRFVAMDLFGNINKPTLNKVSGSLRKLRPGIWMELALEDIDAQNNLVVVDGVRYPEDFKKLREMNFLLIYVQSSNELLERRLKKREGEAYFDQLSLSYEENALSGFKFDLIIKNDFKKLSDLFKEVDARVIQ